MKRLFIYSLLLFLLCCPQLQARALDKGRGFVPLVTPSYSAATGQMVTGPTSFWGNGQASLLAVPPIEKSPSNHHMKIPMRAGLEYALFSEAEGRPRSYGASTANDAEAYRVNQAQQIHTMFVNAYYDIHTETALSPYLGAGLGMAYIHARSATAGDGSLTALGGANLEGDKARTSANLAWNLGAGLALDMGNALRLDMGYRFMGLGKVDSSAADMNRGAPRQSSARSEVKDLYVHQLAVGARFTF